MYVVLICYSLIFVKQNYAVSKGLKLKPSPSGKENPKTKEMKKEKVIILPPEPLFWDVLLWHTNEFSQKNLFSNYLHDK